MIIFEQRVLGRKIKTRMTKVLVRDDGEIPYACMWMDRPIRVKCGKCLRGVLSVLSKGSLIMRLGLIEKCLVCGARTEIS